MVCGVPTCDRYVNLATIADLYQPSLLFAAFEGPASAKLG
jgi:hypothetical protein